MAKMAAIGFCCVDLYEDLNLSYPTGNGINAIINLSKLGVSCSAVSVVGTDKNGKDMLDTLHEYRIDTSHMQIREGRTSIFEMKLLENNDRLHLRNIPGVMETYIPSQEDILFTQEHEYIHTDLFGKVLPIIPRLKEKDAKLVLDFSVYANNKNMAELLPYVDYAFFSVGEGKRDEAVILLRKARQFSEKVLTATLGKDGSICSDGQRFYEGKAFPVLKVVNAVGAGDSFIAGFMEGVMLGKTIPDCLKNGAELAAQIVTQFKPY